MQMDVCKNPKFIKKSDFGPCSGLLFNPNRSLGIIYTKPKSASDLGLRLGYFTTTTFRAGRPPTFTI